MTRSFTEICLLVFVDTGEWLLFSSVASLELISTR